MNKLARFITVLIVLGCIGMPLLAGSPDQAPVRRWHFQVSAFGGFQLGAQFIHHFRLYSDREMTLWYNDDKVSEAWDTADAAFVPGASLGVEYGMSRIVSLYAKFSYLPTVRFEDGIEETIQTFDITDTATYGKIAEYAQTSRKAQAFGFSVGSVITPFSRIPVGFDLELGLWGYSQEFQSETCLKYDNDAVFTSIENRNELDGRDVGDYLGRGKWSEKHLCVLLGLGVKYFPFRWASVDINWRTLGYIKGESTNYVYEDSGDPVTDPTWYTATSILSAGLTFYF